MTRYLRRRDTRHDGRLRMFCFPYAGGGASVYAGWQSRLGTGVEVLPVQLPGREGRMAEPRFTDLSALVTDLDRELGDELDGPHVLYGHSMGALVAFALAQHRRARGERLPQALLLGAHRAPHLPPPPITHGYGADDTELVRGLASLGGLPRVLLDRPDWLAALLPVVRGDLMLCDGAGGVDRTPLPIPLHTFAGAEDRLVTVPEIREWSRYTHGDCETTVVPGDHFFIKDRESVFLDRLSEVLDRYTGIADLLGMDLVGAPGD